MLINCVAYHQGQKLGDIAVDAIPEHLARPDCLVWVALQEPTPDEISHFGRQFALHPLAVEDALHGHQRPKLEEFGDTLFLVMKTLEPDSENGIHVGEVDLFVGRNFLLSIRNQTRKGFQDVRARCEREPHLLAHGSGFVLYALMDAVVDRYLTVIHQLEDELDSIEGRLFLKGSSARRNIAALYALKRKLISVNHAAAPLHEATARLYGGRVPPPCHDLPEYFRDVDDHLSRILHTVESQRDLLATAIQVNIAMISLDESSISKKLAAYAALFAVPTMIAGIYGMNFDYMPELRTPLGYPLSLLSMVVLDVLLWRRFRRAGWL
ncbi:magnesium/cobalt transporter CorA [Vogesella indigofera]|uniref:magnesium/cobalt transporter CorA n=1 Tax=Vogesella indigofera TaxID=45465 RepID=UPI00234E82DD|nr:magnesium/cobalt transporter CorA [Vogesella indigofera]MDC7707360.1 magnesium/cobalt transporter CorA [Vogesella indigofera]